MIRNLLYNCYIRPDNEAGLHNIEILNQYAHVFNGRKIVLVKTDKNSLSLKQIQGAFTFPAEFIEYRNNPKRGEVVGFLAALDMLRSRNPNEATFYAHTKGVSRNSRERELIRPWYTAMYHECLSEPDLVDKVLALHPLAGCFKRNDFWPEFETQVKWYYSGTFFWFRHDAVFSRPDWRATDSNRFGVETWLPRFMAADQAFTLYREFPKGDCFDWRHEELESREIPRLSVLIPTIGRPHLRTLLAQLRAQISVRDEILVLGDGHCPAAREMADETQDPRVRYLEYPEGPMKDWGHTVRNWAMPKAKGTHLMFFDDDDTCLPKSFNYIRRAILQKPENILLFRMHHENEVLWRYPKVEHGNVSTQMVVVPNNPERLGTWKPHTYEGDFYFIKSCVERHPDREAGVSWQEEITTVHGIGGDQQAMRARDPRWASRSVKLKHLRR